MQGCSSSDEDYDSGYNDGYAVGYNTTCKIRLNNQFSESFQKVSHKVSKPEKFFSQSLISRGSQGVEIIGKTCISAPSCQSPFRI